MNNSHHPIHPIHHLLRGLVIAAAALACASALAATQAAGADRAASAVQAHARCAHGLSHADSGSCMTKAEFDLTRSRQAALDADPAQYMRNALVRCERLAGDDRKDCVSRIQGQGTASGSVAGGGIYRELVTREVGVVPPAQVPDAAAPNAPKK